MLTTQIQALLASGAAEIVGLVGPDGRPHALRGFGIEVLAPEGDQVQVRVLLRAVDLRAVGLEPGDRPGVPIAVTASDVATLYAIQVKGRLLAVDLPIAGDAERSEHHMDEFIRSVVEADRITVDLMELWRPTGDDLVAGLVQVEELFEQTPGPGAGARLPDGVR